MTGMPNNEMEGIATNAANPHFGRCALRAITDYKTIAVIGEVNRSGFF